MKVSSLKKQLNPSRNFSFSTPVCLKFNIPLVMDGVFLLKNILPNTVTLVFFDPQYRGVLDKLNYGNEGKRQILRKELLQMSETTIKEFIGLIDKVIKPSGHLFLWIDKFHFCEGISSWLQNTSLQVVDLIVWNKQRIGMGYRSRRSSEFLLIIQKKPIRAKGIWKIKNIPDVWDEKITLSDKKHPHQKPFFLQKKLIETVTNEGDIIVDPAAGSFSILKLCRLLNRKFIGCDIKNFKHDEKI